MVHDKFKRKSSVQDVTWFLDLNESKKLDLNPSYQRRSVWTRKDKLFFLDTIFKGYPCPAVYLHKTLDDKGKSTYHVIDGKQRLTTILDFVESRLTLPKDFDNSNPELAGKKWNQINDVDRRKLFWNYSIPVDQFDSVEASTIDAMFDRLNRNTKKLEPQELRHAKYDGWFINFAESLSEDVDSSKYAQYLRDLKVVTSGRSKRMKDVQFISELMLIVIKGKINGFSQDMIDDNYALYDNPEIELDFSIEDFEHEFNSVIEYIYNLNEINKCILTHSTTVGQFYTLFAVIALYKDVEFKKENTQQIVDKYVAFMNLYEENKEQSTSQDDDIIAYTKASTGANTEEPLRQIRYDILYKNIFE